MVYANKVSAITAAGFGDVQAEADKLLNDFRSSYGTTTATNFTSTITLATSWPIGTKVAVILVLADSKIGATTVTAATVTCNAASAIPGDTLTITDLSAIEATAVGQGNGKYLAGYFTSAASIPTGTTFTITFTAPAVLGAKISRVIIGEYWTPTYNTGFGMEVGYDDTSSAERTQAGDLYTINGPSTKTLTFSLEYLHETDKFHFYKILGLCGKRTPIFVSLFPDGTTQQEDEKEQMYSIYGKFTDLTTITHTMWTMYSSSVSLEEI